MSHSDSELEEDEEEIFVYVEFDNCTTSDVFSDRNLKVDMLGLDSDHPVMQVNGKFFEGNYEDAVGTYLFFDKDDNPVIDDPVFDKVPQLKYFAKSRKLLRMQRAFIVPRYEVVGDSQHSKSIPNMDTLSEAGVAPKYQDEALQFWQESRNQRLEALHKYLKKQEFRKELRQRGFEPESESDEDNPFAMYKYADTDDETTRIVNCSTNDENNTEAEDAKSTQQTFDQNSSGIFGASDEVTVMDPGPSTSTDGLT
ncbi:hypothetical protein QAD02_017260 [Eretmocerus hayati]|uniref:Uncharacterized protein n=1 Tax=Eretmocerus hayati TaxID=131215 RepID=A0ACC2PDD6_9HYME|nr:hypothetical protein QAD02_017260 [Eretmocerus hayati]